MPSDFELLSEEKWLDYWENYQGLEHQKASVLQLRKGILGAQAGLMATTAPWAKTFTPKGAPPAAQKPPAGVQRRAITYFRQTDSRIAADRDSMCFSSTAAMFATYYRPGLFNLPNGDDDYLKLLRQHGGISSSAADQVAQLRRLGVKAVYINNGTRALLERVTKRGDIAMVGWYHNGPVSRPRRDSGHWSLVGETGPSGVKMWDPNGEADLVRGGYLPNMDGEGLAYSWTNWLPRWEADGPGTGWAITIER